MSQPYDRGGRASRSILRDARSAESWSFTLAESYLTDARTSEVFLGWNLFAHMDVTLLERRAPHTMRPTRAGVAIVAWGEFAFGSFTPALVFALGELRVLPEEPSRLLVQDLVPELRQDAAVLEVLPDLAGVLARRRRDPRDPAVDVGLADADLLAPRDLVDDEWLQPINKDSEGFRETLARYRWPSPSRH